MSDPNECTGCGQRFFLADEARACEIDHETGAGETDEWGMPEELTGR